MKLQKNPVDRLESGTLTLWIFAGDQSFEKITPVSMDVGKSWRE